MLFASFVKRVLSISTTTKNISHYHSSFLAVVCTDMKRHLQFALMVVAGFTILGKFRIGCLGQIDGKKDPGPLMKPPYTEKERRAEYERRGHAWPLTANDYVPNTTGWIGLMEKLFEQIGAIEDPQEKWFAWTGLMGPAKTMGNYTEVRYRLRNKKGFIYVICHCSILKSVYQLGWGLTRGPEDLNKELREAIYQGLPNARLERNLKGAVDGPTPLFIDRPDLTKLVSKRIQPILEAWVSRKITPSLSYGFRLYSCIYHIASSTDSQPWPIVLEDYSGNTNSVVLKPGDILLYESAKILHGRPQQFHGTWYTSVFVHFYPNEKDWRSRDRELEKHYAIPPGWRNISASSFPRLQMIGTNMMEPTCKDYWCNLESAVELEGPGTYGLVISGRGDPTELDLGSGDEGLEL